MLKTTLFLSVLFFVTMAPCDLFMIVCGAAIQSDAHPDQEAIDRIEGLGGKVTRVLVDEGYVVKFEKPVADSDLVELQSLKNLVALVLSNTGTTDAGLVALKKLPDLKELYLYQVKVTGNGLKHLNELTQLRSIGITQVPFTDSDLKHLEDLKDLVSFSVRGTQITDDGVKHFATYSRLQSLTLDSCQITGSGLKSLNELKDLKQIFMSRTQITDEGLANLSGLDKLVNISLQETPITDAGLVHLKNLAAIKILQLENTEIGDAGLEHLKNLKNLHHLSLRGTRITDTGLKHLLALESLQVLGISGTAISNDGVAQLKRALPRCRISAYGMKTKEEVDRNWAAKKEREEREQRRLAKQRREKLAKAALDQLAGDWEEMEILKEGSTRKPNTYRSTYKWILEGAVLEGNYFSRNRHIVMMLLNATFPTESSSPTFDLLIVGFRNGSRQEVEGTWDDAKTMLTFQGKLDGRETALTYYFTDDRDSFLYTWSYKVEESFREHSAFKCVRRINRDAPADDQTPIAPLKENGCCGF
jgi:hypothetical protein